MTALDIGLTSSAECSRVGQVEAALDTFDTRIHPIKPARHIRILVLKIANALLDLPDIIAHVIDGTADMAHVLKNDIVRISHGFALAHARGLVNKAR